MERYLVVVMGKDDATSNYLKVISALHQVPSNPIDDFKNLEIKYETYTVKYISVPPENEKIEEVFNEHKLIHGFHFVITSYDAKIPHECQRELTNMFGQVPRTAFNMCCIINIFTESLNYKTPQANDDCADYLKDLCEKHHLKGSGNTKMYLSISDIMLSTSGKPENKAECSTNLKSRLQQILDTLPSSCSVLNSTFEIFSCWLKLNQPKSTLYKQKNSDNSNFQQLLVTLSYNVISPLTLGIRKRNLDAKILDAKELLNLFKKCKQEFDDDEVKIIKDLCKKTASLYPLHPLGTTFLVYICGNLEDEKKLMLNTINMALQYESFDDAVKNGLSIEFSDDVIEFDNYKFQFKSMPSLSNKMDKLPDEAVNGFVFVENNATVEEPLSHEVEVRNSFSRLIRDNFENACIGNMFYKSQKVDYEKVFQANDAFLKKFQTQHALKTTPQHIAIDKMFIQRICEKTDDATVQNKNRITWQKIRNDVIGFLKSLITLDAVTSRDFNIAIGWNHLNDALKKHRNNSDMKPLMATLADNALTNMAIYWRSLKDSTQPINIDNWPATIQKLEPINPKIAELFLQVKNLWEPDTFHNGLPAVRVRTHLYRLYDPLRTRSECYAHFADRCDNRMFIINPYSGCYMPAESTRSQVERYMSSEIPLQSQPVHRLQPVLRLDVTCHHICHHRVNPYTG